MRKIQVQVFRKQRIVRIIFDPNKEVRGKGWGFDMPFDQDWHDDSRDPQELLNGIIYHVGSSNRCASASNTSSRYRRYSTRDMTTEQAKREIGQASENARPGRTQSRADSAPNSKEEL
jgi:hypothetical protein